MAPARVVGLTGGIGSGKSEALAAFRRRGAATLSSDDVVHELYRRGDVRRAVRERYGDAVFDPSEAVDRRALAARAFDDPAERRWLEGVLLPLLAEEFARWRDHERAAGAPLLVHEAPTLFEAGVQDRYDAIVTITAPEEVRLRRRPGAEARMAHQLPEAEKAARSDYVYENAAGLDALDAFVARVFAELVGP
jgi:dephospho-CoA kinase